jgi:hypothetical protein
MNHVNARFLILLLAISFSACSHAASSHHGFAIFDNGAVSLKHGTVVIKLKGHDQARVTGEGKLSIGGTEVAVSPQAQVALARYNAGAVVFTDQAKSLGVDSADFALHTIGQTFKGILHGNTDQVGDEADQGAKLIEAKARLLCQRMDEWRAAQDAAAQVVPEFKPYAVISADQTRDCDTDAPDPLSAPSASSPQISS